jgi:TPR repeat protein
MDNKAATKILEEAEKALDAIGAKAAYELLEPLIAERNAAALFLYACFSISGEETDEEFDARRIKLLRETASLGYAPAIYQLAMCYEIGDLVERDTVLASALYKQAAEAGYPKSD